MGDADLAMTAHLRTPDRNVCLSWLRAFRPQVVGVIDTSLLWKSNSPTPPEKSSSDYSTPDSTDSTRPMFANDCSTKSCENSIPAPTTDRLPRLNHAAVNADNETSTL